MRSFLLVFAVCTFGCSNSNPSGIGSGGGEDMAVQADLAVEADMARPPAGPLTCSGVIQCLQGAGSQGGAQMCLMRATPKATMLLNAVLACGKAACGDYDGGPGTCAGPDDQSMECQQCAQQDLQTGDCMAEIQACLSDT
jgi:hypothetical protein